MNEIIRAHVRLLESVSDIKVWLWTVAATSLLPTFERYVFSDWDFLAYLLVMMLCDLASGLGVALKDRVAVTSIGLRRTVLKCIQYGLFLIVMHVLAHFTIKGEEQIAYHYITQGAFILLMGIEGKSVLENLKKMDDRLDIGVLVDRIKEVFTKKKE